MQTRLEMMRTGSTSSVLKKASKLCTSGLGDQISSPLISIRIRRMIPSPLLPPISSLIRTENRTHACQKGERDRSATKDLARTRWLALSTLHYRYSHDPPNTYPRKWDVASRNTRVSENGADAVVVLARLNMADERILLVKQYRPPMDAVSIELPAGLIDVGETAESAALRELREETGFVGKVARVHPAASLSPGMSDETVCLVEIVVEGAGAGQECEPGENIEVISVPLGRFEEAVEHIAKTENAVVMHAVSTLGMGLRIGGLIGK